MNNNNLQSKEEPVEEEFEIVATKRTKIDKDKFFKLLAKHDTLNLTIDRVGKVGKSKFKNNDGVYPYGCFIDYYFSVENTDYEIGIYYNLGVPTSEEKFKLASGYYIFKLLEIVVDLSEAEEISVNESFISNKLTGIKFKATLGSSKNGFYIKPVELID